MRFGITALEFETTAKQVIVDGFPDFSRFNIIEAIRRAAAIEYITVVELTLDIRHIIPGSIPDSVIDNLIDLRDEVGIGYTVHLPLWSLEPASFNEHIRRASVECIVDSIMAIERLDPEVYVLHSTGPLGAEFSRLRVKQSVRDLICQLMASISIRSVTEILERTNIRPRKLAIENVEFPFQFTRDVVDECDTGICFDTGHLLARYSGKEDPIEFYRQHHDRIVEIHLHDGRFRCVNGVSVPEDHKTLGTGDLRVEEFLCELVHSGFRGPVIFELTNEETVRSLEVVRERCPRALDKSGS
ncbi:MAG: cobamide remodeling phosphodiesterase CbiR [Candidatus Thorarchaeota archaeon]